MPNADSGLVCLAMLLRFHGVIAEVAQLRHAIGHGEPPSVTDLLRQAKSFGVKARVIQTDQTRWEGLPLPALGVRSDRSCFVLGKVTPDKVLIQDPAVGRPTALTRKELAASWDGTLVLITKRASLSDLTRKFDIT